MSLLLDIISVLFQLCAAVVELIYVFTIVLFVFLVDNMGLLILAGIVYFICA